MLKKRLTKSNELVLETQQIALKPWRRQDLKTYVRLREENQQHLAPWEASNPPQNSAFENQGEPAEVASAQTPPVPIKIAATSYFKWMLERQKAGEVRSWAIWVHGSNSEAKAEIVGEVLLAPLVSGAYSYARLGYWLAESHTGQGIATQAVTLAIHYCLSKMNINRIEALVQPDNIRSKYLLQRLNLRSEGIRKNCVFVQGAWRDHEVFAITWAELEDWEQETYKELLTIK